MKKLLQRIRKNVKDLMFQLIIPLLIMLIVVVYFAHRTFVFIHPGEAGVLWKRFFGGTVINYVYPEGFQLVFPWDEMFIYDVRIQELSFELDVLSKTGLRIHIYISTRYAPDYQLLGVLHQKVGPDYAQKIIIPEIESVLRDIIGTMAFEQIYTSGRRVIVEAINQAIEQISQRYINVDKVLITKIDLPDSVAKAIRYKIEQKQLIEAQEYKVQREEKEAERKRIEGQGIRDQFKIVSEALQDEKILKWRGIEATLKLAESTNSKVVIIGSGQEPFQLFGQVPLAPDEWSFPNITGASSPSGLSDVPETPELTDMPDSPPPDVPETTVSPPDLSGASEEVERDGVGE